MVLASCCGPLPPSPNGLAIWALLAIPAACALLLQVALLGRNSRRIGRPVWRRTLFYLDLAAVLALALLAQQTWATRAQLMASEPQGPVPSTWGYDVEHAHLLFDTIGTLTLAATLVLIAAGVLSLTIDKAVYSDERDRRRAASPSVRP